MNIINKADLGSKLEDWASQELIAVSEKRKDWTYSEFVSHAYMARDYFKKNNVKHVMVCLPQGFYAYAIIWGAYLSGTVFCPVSTEVPKDRLTYFSEVFKPDVIISTLHKGPVNITPEDFFSQTQESSPQNEEIVHSPSSTAYVIFTSGSTGKPKGVMIARESLENVIQWGLSEYEVTQHDVWGQYSSLGFDLSILDIFVAISAGAKLVPFNDLGERLLPSGLIKEKKITIWHSVPSVVDLISKANLFNIENIASLRTLIFCGEKLFPTQLALIFSNKEDMLVYNTYGPTEATIMCTYVKLTKDNYQQFSENTVSIGDVIPNTGVHLDNVVDGLGELVISGINVGIGYMQETPTSGYKTIEIESQAIDCYFTGDYCRYSDGKLYYDCRKDSQIKLNGYRIDLSEIDYQVRSFGSKASMTIQHEEKIILFLVDAESKLAELKAWLTKSLPKYYMPHQIVFLEKMPYNLNGKVDIHQLKKHLKKV